jgi:hypothetical protein
MCVCRAHFTAMPPASIQSDMPGVVCAMCQCVCGKGKCGAHWHALGHPARRKRGGRQGRPTARPRGLGVWPADCWRSKRLSLHPEIFPPLSPLFMLCAMCMWDVDPLPLLQSPPILRVRARTRTQIV